MRGGRSLGSDKSDRSDGSDMSDGSDGSDSETVKMMVKMGVDGILWAEN